MKEREDDRNQVKFEFDLKLFVNQFCDIMHISQTILQIKMKFYMKVLDTWNYIMVDFHVIWSLKNILF